MTLKREVLRGKQKALEYWSTGVMSVKNGIMLKA
jgi:hypothetical protein